jgi:hypothetical protein
MSIDPIANAAKKNIIANAAKTIGTFFFLDFLRWS